jgi:hypothetical protein
MAMALQVSNKRAIRMGKREMSYGKCINVVPDILLIGAKAGGIISVMLITLLYFDIYQFL